MCWILFVKWSKNKKIAYTKNIPEIYVSTLLSNAFETGKIDGSGYGYKVHDSYGSECGEMFIVSVAPIWSWSVRSLFVYFSQRKTMIDGVRSYLSFFKSHVFK